MTDLQSFILFLSLGWITGAVTVTAVTVIKIKELVELTRAEGINGSM